MEGKGVKNKEREQGVEMEGREREKSGKGESGGR